MGRGGAQVVSMFAFYSNNPSSNPTEAESFFCKFVFEKNRNKQKDAGVGPFKKLFMILTSRLQQLKSIFLACSDRRRAVDTKLEQRIVNSKIFSILSSDLSRSFFFFKWANTGLFLFIFVFSTVNSKCNQCKNLADDWIRTADLWYQKRPLCQLSHNHCLSVSFFLSIRFSLSTELHCEESLQSSILLCEVISYLIHLNPFIILVQLCFCSSLHLFFFPSNSSCSALLYLRSCFSSFSFFLWKCFQFETLLSLSHSFLSILICLFCIFALSSPAYDSPLPINLQTCN